MSELTPCCHCTLKQIRRHAPEGARVVVRPAGASWRKLMPKAVEVLVVPEGAEIPPEGELEDPDGAPRYWVATLGELTNHCVC